MDRQELNDKITAVSKTIFLYCMARTPNRETAEDLSQEIICELIRSADNIRDERAFYGFMWSLAGNIYCQWYRRKLGTTEGELSDSILAEEDVFTDCGEEAERRENDLYLLRRELSLLSAKYRRATVMYYIEEKSCREISESLNVSESMVKYLLFKSRKILKEGMCMERRLQRIRSRSGCGHGEDGICREERRQIPLHNACLYRRTVRSGQRDGERICRMRA